MMLGAASKRTYGSYTLPWLSCLQLPHNRRAPPPPPRLVFHSAMRAYRHIMVLEIKTFNLPETF